MTSGTKRIKIRTRLARSGSVPSPSACLTFMMGSTHEPERAPSVNIDTRINQHGIDTFPSYKKVCSHKNIVYQPDEKDTNATEYIYCEDCGEEVSL